MIRVILAGVALAAALMLAAPVSAQSAAEGTLFQAVLVPGEGGQTLLYLADADSNAPVGGAAVEAEAGGWKGPAAPTAAEGVYALAWFPPPEGVDITLTVSAGGQDDLLLLTGVKPIPSAGSGDGQPRHWLHWSGGALIGAAMAVVGFLLARRRTVAAILLALALASPAYAHEGHDHGAPEPAKMPVLPGQAVTMPKATQFLLGIRTRKIEPKEAADTVRVVGRVVPDPAGFARIQPSQPARVLAEDGIPFPVSGQAVKKGQVLAVLEPTLTAIEKGDRRAALARIDSELAVQEREVPRMEALKSAIPFRTLETAHIRLDQLRRERAQIAGTALGRELVIAPIGGVVTDVHLVPGEVVTVDRVLIEVVDPAKLRVEAVIHDLDLAGRIAGASAATKLIPDEVVPLTLLGVSPRVDAVDQGVHAAFAVNPGHAEKLRLGMPVDVFVATGAVRMRTAVPRDAIAEVGGRQVVFIRTAPETFEARPVRIERVVGPLAELADGSVAAGEKVVVQGVEQLKAAR